MNRFKSLTMSLIFAILVAMITAGGKNNAALAFPDNTPQATAASSVPTIAPTPISSVDIQFKGVDDLVIYGLHYPAPQQPAPAFLLLHEDGGNKDEWFAWAPQWAARGFNIFTIDYRGFGKTRGEDDNVLIDQDLQLVLEQINENPAVMPHQIAILGGSRGGGFALVACAVNPDCKTVILLSGTDYKGDLDDPMAALGSRPIFLAAAEFDEPFVKTMKAYAEQAKGAHELIITERNYHATLMLYKQPEMVTAIGDWLVKYLPSKDEPAATLAATSAATP